VGDALVAQGKLPEALSAFQDCFAISERQAHMDPNNVGLQRDMSFSNERLGDVLLAQGKLGAVVPPDVV
jgi:hypothetical protein